MVKQRRLKVLCVVAVLILFVVGVCLIANWKYSGTRLKGLTDSMRCLRSATSF